MKRFLIIVVLLLSFALAATAFAATSYPWNNHAAPYDFLFGNHIDTHQQTKLNDDGQLGGFFYIKYTGETYPPEADDGIPVAGHGNCEGAAVECTVGWRLKGVSVQATPFSKAGKQPPDLVYRSAGYTGFTRLFPFSLAGRAGTCRWPHSRGHL